MKKKPFFRLFSPRFSFSFEPFFEPSAMGVRSRVAALPVLAGLVLLCSATRAQVSVFPPPSKSQQQNRKPTACRSLDVISSALEEDGGFSVLCSCLLCWLTYHSWILTNF
jgi:hypothetical protein